MLNSAKDVFRVQSGDVYAGATLEFGKEGVGVYLAYDGLARFAEQQIDSAEVRAQRFRAGFGGVSEGGGKRIRAAPAALTDV